MALIFFGAVVISALASAPPKRSVEMEITLPNGSAPRVIVPEDEGAIVKLPDGKRFGFVPTLRSADGTAVAVGIWDVDSVPFHKVGQVEVDVGGPVTHSDTSPSFGIRIVRVVKSK
jgi:streptogramin lyase